MTYRTARSLVEIIATAAAAFIFLGVPITLAVGLNWIGLAVLGAGSFLAIFATRDRIAGIVDATIYRGRFGRPDTRIILDFADQIGKAFTIPDLIEAARDKLEKSADMGVILLRPANWEILYQSPAAATNDRVILEHLKVGSRSLPEGLSFIDGDFHAVKTNAHARGFVINCKGFMLFVLSRLCPLVEIDAFKTLYGELNIYFERVGTISELFEVASLSKEWELIAETQRSFLPRTLPKTEKLDLGVVYRPLVNVSGDYYDAIKVDESRTLLVVGDVSGKGLAAALIMGIIVNTIRVAQDKTDLAALIRTVDSAIREMGFDDKYTVIFLGLVDTKGRTLRYVNAAMADPLIISQTALGPRVKRLDPTMSLVGLVPLEEIGVEEIPIRTDEIILLASDGVTEVANEAGERLGEMEIFEKTLGQASKLPITEFVSNVSALLYSFVGDRPLKDDVTILAAKVGRLWD